MEKPERNERKPGALQGKIGIASDFDTPLELKRRGRPAGSGEQLPPTERSRQSRQNRTAQGATRLDFYLDPDQAGLLTDLMQQWSLKTKKEVVQRALDIVHQTVAKNRKAT